MTDTNPDEPVFTLKALYDRFVETKKLSETYRNFLYNFHKLKLDKTNLDIETIAKLTEFYKLKNTYSGYLFKNPEQKTKLMGEIYQKCKVSKDGIKFMNGKDFLAYLVDTKFMTRTQVYTKAKKVNVNFSTNKIISLGDARKIILGVPKDNKS